MNQPKRPHYRSYLLCGWAETDANGEIIFWRFSLQDPRTGQRRGFASLTELVIALQDELMGERQGVGVEERSLLPMNERRTQC
jgi:hypothetical protein